MFLSPQKLSELDPFRYELKIPLEKVQFNEFKHCLRQLELYPVQAYPGRQINSVYFDSYDFNDYVDNVSGIADRCKTRIRWYNEDIKALTLELKIKKNKASYKESLKLKNPDGHDPRTRRGVQDIMGNHMGTMERLMLKNVRPVLEVQYQRTYSMLDKDLRMTIDVEQKFRRLYPHPSKILKRSPVYCVVEFKFPAAKREAMYSLMRNIPFRVFRHSKYVIGMDTVAP